MMDLEGIDGHRLTVYVNDSAFQQLVSFKATEYVSIPLARPGDSFFPSLRIDAMALAGLRAMMAALAGHLEPALRLFYCVLNSQFSSRHCFFLPPLSIRRIPCRLGPSLA